MLSLKDTIPQPTEEELAARRAYWKTVTPAIGARWNAVPEAPTCETCGGAGWVNYRKYENGVYIGSEAGACNNPNCTVVRTRREQHFNSLLTGAQIPAEYQALTLAQWGDLHDDVLEGKRDALEAAVLFTQARADGFRFCLPQAGPRAKCSIVYSGPNGVGKTSLAVSIASLLLEAGVPVKYALAGEWFAALTERFDRKDEYEFESELDDQASVMGLYQNAPVLIFDELPRPPGKSDWWKKQLYQLINHRYTHQLPTVITTNLDAETLCDLWEMTIGSRVLAMAHWIEVGGLDMRLALAGSVVVSR